MRFESTSAHAVTVKLIPEMIEFIERNLLEPMTPASIAKAFYLSAASVNTLFKVVCDISIMEYIRNRRLTLACEELLASDARIIDLALKYGYETPEAFTKAFSRLHGFPPSHIRRLYPQIALYSPLEITLTIRGGWTTNPYLPGQEKHSQTGHNEPITLGGGLTMKTKGPACHIHVDEMKHKEDWKTLLKLTKALDEQGIAHKVDGKTMVFAHGLEFKLDKICLTFKWGDEEKVRSFFVHGVKAQSTSPGFKYFDSLFDGMKVRCIFYGDCPGDQSDEFLYRNTDTVDVDGQILVAQTLKFYHENADKGECYEMVDRWLKHSNSAID